MSKFVVIDPGTTTGVILADLRKKKYGEMGSPSERLRVGMEEGDVQALEVDTRRWWESTLADTVEEFMRSGSGGWTSIPLVVEDFILRTQDKRKETLDPIRVTSSLVAVLIDRGWDGKLVLQQPSQAKSVVTDDRLRAWKLWIVGSSHKRDAMRHAVVFLRGE